MTKSPNARMILAAIRLLDKEVRTKPQGKRAILLNKKCDLVIAYIMELRKKILYN